MMMGVARSVRELHDAARPASPHRRQSLRADAAERQGAARRLDGHVLPSGLGRRGRLRSDDRAAIRPSDSISRRSATCSTTSRPVPEEFLLWFHRCGWDYKLKSGKTLWNGLCEKYYQGAEQAAAMQTTWQSLGRRIDPQRHKEVADRLAIQVADAAAWRDQILQYFQGFSNRPIVAR